MDNDRNFLNFQLSIFHCLNLVNFDFRKALSVALFTFVLFAAFLFEDDDLVGSAVSDDRRADRCTAAELGIFAFANEQSIERYLAARFLIYFRYTKRLAARDRKLLSACSDNCVTHYSVSSLELTVQFSAQVEKLKLYVKQTLRSIQE